MNWTKTLMEWYNENKRDLSWRKSKDPYHIWLSEIILQQTRIAQGIPYYDRFIKRYPTVLDLAGAAEDDVLKLWQGLGYYSRARNLLHSAKWIVNENGGQFPTNHRELLQLKGVGDYTASAISSICFNEKQAVVDGNVFRFLARFFGIETPIDHGSAHRIFKSKATTLMQEELPGEFNQALMEFGALHCTPKKTACTTCPFSSNCFAFQQGKVEYFPIKTKRIKMTKRYFNYLVVKTPGGKTIVHQRSGKGIWQNLYEFPLIESSENLSLTKLRNHLAQSDWEFGPIKCIDLRVPKPIKHILSHQHLYIQFWSLELERENRHAISIHQLNTLAVPVVIQDFIKKHYHD